MWSDRKAVKCQFYSGSLWLQVDGKIFNRRPLVEDISDVSIKRQQECSSWFTHKDLLIIFVLISIFLVLMLNLFQIEQGVSSEQQLPYRTNGDHLC